MSSSPSLASDKERRLNEALAEYLEAEEAGQPVDRAVLLARHPDLTAELNEFFANRAGLASLARPFRAGHAAANPCETVSPEEVVLPPEVGRRFGDYEILSEIARGGMGIVYRARDLKLNRDVALKMILAGQLASRSTLRRFKIEAEAAAQLDHPNIVPLYEVGEVAGQPYFTMKLIEAGSLASRLGDFRLPGTAGPPPGLPGRPPTPAPQHDDQPRPNRRLLAQRQDRITSLLATVARAVHHAHQRGILHRDLKPGNILLDANGNPLLTDFGLAKRFEQESQKVFEKESKLTEAQTIVGTAAYMAPEQARPGKDALTTAADVYALGAILYELLTGRPPLVGESCFDTLVLVVQEQPVPPRQRNRHVPIDLDAICLKCLAKEPGQRYGSALELAEDLERVQAGEGTSLRPQTRTERSWRWVRRNRLAATLLAAVSVLVAVVLVGSPIAVWNIAAARNEADRQAADARVLAEQEREARTAAEEAQQLALGSLEAEKAALARNQRLLASSYVANGTHALDSGDPFGALVWYGEALHLDHGDPEREDPHRVRIAAVLRRCPKLVQVWFEIDQGQTAFSPTGRRVLSVQKDSARLLDVADGKSVAELKPGDKIERAIFSPDGQRILVVCARGTAHLYYASTGRETSSSPLVHGAAINHAAFSADGRKVVTAGKDRSVRVWNAETGRMVGGPFDHKMPVWFASFSPDGKRLVTCTGEKKREIQIWEVGPKVKSSVRTLSTEELVHWAYLTDQTHVVSMSGPKHVVHLWDLNLPPPYRPIGPGIEGIRLDPTGVLSPDGRRVVKLEGSTAQVHELASGKPVGPPLVHGSEAKYAAFSPDGKWVVTTSRDRTARVWDAASGQPVSPPLHHGQSVLRAAFSTDGRCLMTAAFGGFGGPDMKRRLNGPVRVWELGSRELAQPRLHLNEGSKAVLSPDGRLMARVGKDGKEGGVLVEDASSRKVVRRGLRLPRPVTQLVFAPDSRHLLLANEESGRVWDALSGQPATPLFTHAGSVKQVLFTPDGSRVAILGARELQVYNSVTGERQSSHKPPEGATSAGLALNPEGTAVAALFRGPQLLEVRDVVSEKLVGKPCRHPAVVTHAAFSPDGQRLATATAEGLALIWDFTRGRLAAPPLHHNQPVHQVAFSGDSRRLVTVMEDRTLRVWDVATGQPVTPLLHHGEPVVAASLAPDGRRLVARGKSGDCCVWDLRPDLRPEADLRSLTQVLAGQKLDSASGGFETVEPGRLRNAWPGLRARYPQEFSLSGSSQ